MDVDDLVRRTELELETITEIKKIFEATKHTLNSTI